MIADLDGDGSAMTPYRVAHWESPRIDVLCRVIRAALGCIGPDGTPNSEIQNLNFQCQLFAVCLPSFSVAVADFDDAWEDSLNVNSFHPTEPRPNVFSMMRANDPLILKAGAAEGAAEGVAMVNAANAGFILPTVGDPTDAIIAILQHIPGFTVSPAVSSDLCARYVARLQGQQTGWPASLTDSTTGLWDAPAMVAYANALDASPLTAPDNFIHILYELAGAFALANATDF